MAPERRMQSAEAWAQSPIFSWHSQRLACDVFPPSVGFFSDSVCFGQLKKMQKESPVHMQNLASSLLPWSARPCCILLGSQGIGHVWTFSQFLSPKKCTKFEARAACQVAECLNWSRMSWGKECSDSFQAQTQNLWLEKVEYGTLVQAPPPFQQQCDLSVELATTFSSRWHDAIQVETQQLFGLLQFSLVLGKALSGGSQVPPGDLFANWEQNRQAQCQIIEAVQGVCMTRPRPPERWFLILPKRFQFKITPWTMWLFSRFWPQWSAQDAETLSVQIVKSSSR